ncbi:MAG TPA: hypothetical protein VGJ13_10300 [Pseudonocardiaceae bacterium]|jgi:hypothetical protein
MPATSGFQQANAQLTGLAQNQTDLQRAVASGDLWMEAGVAERAAQRCERAIDEIDQSLNDAHRLTRLLPFGDNQDGWAAADRFAVAAQDFMKAMRGAQCVLRNMADTYREAGRTVTEADVTSAQPFQGRSE